MTERTPGGCPAGFAFCRFDDMKRFCAPSLGAFLIHHLDGLLETGVDELRRLLRPAVYDALAVGSEQLPDLTDGVAAGVLSRQGGGGDLSQKVGLAAAGHHLDLMQLGGGDEIDPGGCDVSVDPDDVPNGNGTQGVLISIHVQDRCGRDK